MSEFVGRATELNALISSLELVRSGRGALALIEGEPGIGKTRLADEFCGHAGAAGFRVAWGRCVDLEGAPAYWPWIQVLGSLANQTAMVLTSDDTVSDKTFLLPGFRAVDRDRRDDEDRWRLFDAVVDRLRAASDGGGLVIVLDDLQWADRPSLALLRHLSRRLSGVALLTIAIYRDNAAGDEGPLRAVKPDLVSAPGALRLKLASLGREDVGRYLVAACGPQIDADLTATIHNWTGGNPLFVGQLASLLADQDGVRPDALPEQVGEVIAQRLQRLSERCREALAAAAVLGREFSLMLLSKVADQPAELLLEQMDEAAAAGIVAWTAAGDHYRFMHDVVRESVYGAQPASQRIAMHRRAAEQIEDGAVPADLAALAHHWFHAAPLSGWEKAVHYSVQAARRAEDQLAHEEAARLCVQALHALTDSPDQDERRCELLIRLARAQYRSGEVGLSLDSCVEGAAIAARLGRADLQAQAALVIEGVSDRELGPAMRRLCTDALAAVAEDDTTLRARLLGQSAALLEDVPGAGERRRHMSREALHLAEQVGDEKTLAAALHGRHAATTGPDDVEERLEVGTRLVELARSSRWTVEAHWGRLWRIDSLFQLGRLSSIAAELIELEDIVRRLHQPFFRWHLLRSRAALAHVTGHFDEARDLTEQAFAVGRAEQHRTTEIVYRGARACLDFDRGDGAAIEEYLAMVARGPRYDLPTINAGAAVHEIALGRTDAAQDRFDRVIASYPTLDKDGRWLLVSTHLARAAVVLGSRDQIRMLYEALTPYGRLFAVSGAGAAICRGAVAQQLGELAQALRLNDDADRHLSDAIVLNRAAGATPFVAYSQVSHARALALAGAPVRARAEARAALATAARLGMRPLREESTRLLAELNRGAPRLSEREAEVTRLLAGGLSNREIAGALHLSERTAESHVKHIMDKLGFRSRSQIAGWAVEQGLAGDAGTRRGGRGQ